MKKVKTSDHFRAASDRWSVESSERLVRVRVGRIKERVERRIRPDESKKGEVERAMI